MPYKCTVCCAEYGEGSPELRRVMERGGCTCGKKFLTYVKAKPKTEDVTPNPEHDIKEQEETIYEPETPAHPGRDKLEWLDREFVRMRGSEEPLRLSIETIRIIEEGRYHIDIGSLMRGKPLIIKTEEGVYYIDLPKAMKKK